MRTKGAPAPQTTGPMTRVRNPKPASNTRGGALVLLECKDAARGSFQPLLSPRLAAGMRSKPAGLIRSGRPDLAMRVRARGVNATKDHHADGIGQRNGRGGPAALGAALLALALTAGTANGAARAQASEPGIRIVDFDWVDSARGRAVPARLHWPADAGSGKRRACRWWCSRMAWAARARL